MEIRLTNNIYCFRPDKNRSGRPAAVAGDDIEPSIPRAIYCRSCGSVVTSRDQELSVDNSHSHTFFNPAGIVFELGCFRRAPGCQAVGQPSSEFTWFSGYQWSFALCRNCQTHLGWHFQGDGGSFFGLILTRLRE